MCIRDRHDGDERTENAVDRVQADVSERADELAAHIPVSYTHLDVYKRQRLRLPEL